VSPQAGLTCRFTAFWSWSPEQNEGVPARWIAGCGVACGPRGMARVGLVKSEFRSTFDSRIAFSLGT
jgi:hypothetical protein